MQQQKKHIVFFTPTLNKTGSEIVLMHLLPFALDLFDVTVITKYKGELYNQLPSGVKKHYLYNNQFGGFFSKLSNKIRNKFVVPGIFKQHSAATWYLNTIMLGDILQYAKANNVKTIVHLHELQQMYSLLSKQDIQTLVDYPVGIIANSNASANVVKEFGRTKSVQVVYPSLDFSKIKTTHADLRNSLGIKPSEFVWLMSGTLDANKNPFLFVDIAKILKEKSNDFKMLWLGNKAGASAIDVEFKNYIKKQNCEDVIVWVNEVGDNYYNYFSLANGFVLTSQFESFSLVTLEALYLGLPVVANDCIGVNEILQDKYGYVVKQKSSADEMATKMLQYMQGELKVDKEVLKQRALEFNNDKIAKYWQTCLKELI